MTVTVAEPEVLAEDTAPTDSTTAAPEQDAPGIAETPQPQEAVMIPLAALTAHPGNVRKNLDVNAAFVASIKAEGIIEPLKITTSATPGVYRVLEGHRRMAGAIKAGHVDVPCVFKESRAQDEAGQFLDQLITSRHKKLLTQQEEANALFAAHEAGASKTRLAGAYGKAKAVNAALKAATLPEETQKATVAAEYEWPIDLLAELAEFADEPDATARLLKAYDDDQFAWQLEREREGRAEEAKREAIRAKQKAAGVTLYEYDDAPAGLVKLASMPTAVGKGIEPETHTDCSGHVAVFERWGPPREFYACADSENCPHIDRENFTTPVVPAPPTSAELVTEAARKKAEDSAKRKKVVQGNKDWRAARTVRHKWLATLMARTSLSREETDVITKWTAHTYLTMSWIVQAGISGQDQLKAELLGLSKPPSDWSKETAKASGKRLVLLTFLPLATSYEKSMRDERWRTDSHEYRSERKQAAGWIKFLMSIGYKPSPIERAVLEDRDYDPGTAAATVPDTLGDADKDEPQTSGQDETSDPSAGDFEAQDETDPDQDGPDPSPGESAQD
jgi:ParB family chromosome partitioning protein